MKLLVIIAALCLPTLVIAQSAPITPPPVEIPVVASSISLPDKVPHLQSGVSLDDDSSADLILKSTSERTLPLLKLTNPDMNSK